MTFMMGKSRNPFRRGTDAYRTFQILSDLEWHCANCELPGSQPAATIRGLRRKGYDLRTAAIKGGDEPPRYCTRCRRRTTHYRLTDLSPIHAPKARTALPSWLKRRVLDLYDKREALTGRKRHPRELTVDHRVPNIRWRQPEKEYKRGMSDEELLATFQLLTNEDNLWKSRMCEICKQTGKRQPFFGIHFFYTGTDKYEEEVGCVGCGWYNPDEWKRALNKLLSRATEVKQSEPHPDGGISP